MQSIFSNVLTLLSAVLAFLPILAVDHLLDDHIRRSETERLQSQANVVAGSMHDIVFNGLDSLATIVGQTPSLCTSTFVDTARSAIRDTPSVQQITVENTDNVQYCDAYGAAFNHTPVSRSFTLPERPETLQLVQLTDSARTAFKLSRPFGRNRFISVFLSVPERIIAMLADQYDGAGAVRLSLTDGHVIGAGGETDLLTASSPATVVASSYADQLPLKVELAVPLAEVRSQYGDLDIGLTLITALMSAAFLLLSLRYVRQRRAPAFDLERAIHRGEIKPFYQPVINLRTGELIGCEVLCRWEKRNGTLIMPGQFIEQAETSGLAVPMTLSLMEQVKADLGELAAERPRMKISINLFDGHFRDGAIIDDVQAIFAGSPIRYGQLVFEITERQPLSNSMQTHAVIAGLHALGAKLAMDDAGTGHSNLAYLATLGVDIIKIDRVFIDMIKPDVGQVPVLDGLISMARDLDAEIVAEGVETMEQAIYLRARGVYQAQGFLFSPALRTAAFLELARALPDSSRKTPPRPSSAA